MGDQELLMMGRGICYEQVSPTLLFERSEKLLVISSPLIRRFRMTSNRLKEDKASLR